MGANPSNKSGVGPRRRDDVTQSREPQKLVCALRHGACGALWTHSVRRLTLQRSEDDPSASEQKPRCDGAYTPDGVLDDRKSKVGCGQMRS